MLNLTTEKDRSLSSIGEEIILVPSKVEVKKPFVRPKPIQTITVRKTIRELKREKLNKEIEANKDLLLAKDDYDLA